MKISVELEQLKMIEKTLADIPRVPLIEQWGLIFVCYNTMRQIRAEAETQAQQAQAQAKED